MDFITSTWFLAGIAGIVVGKFAPGLWTRAKASVLEQLARRFK
jgi:hypothetical protein